MAIHPDNHELIPLKQWRSGFRKDRKLVGGSSLQRGGKTARGVDSVKHPSIGAVVLGIIPFITMCLSVSAWDRVDPMVLGLPFNLFWLLIWIALTSVCLWAANRLETPPDQREQEKRTR